MQQAPSMHPTGQDSSDSAQDLTTHEDVARPGRRLPAAADILAAP